MESMKFKGLKKILTGQNLKIDMMNSNRFHSQDGLAVKNMTLDLNGMKYFFNSKFTVLELIDYLGFNKNVIVIDYNGLLLDKRKWERTMLRNEDSLEIFSIAGGG